MATTMTAVTDCSPENTDQCESFGIADAVNHTMNLPILNVVLVRYWRSARCCFCSMLDVHLDSTHITQYELSVRAIKTLHRLF